VIWLTKILQLQQLKRKVKEKLFQLRYSFFLFKKPGLEKLSLGFLVFSLNVKLQINILITESYDN